MESFTELGWQEKNGKLEKTYVFKDFKSAILFVNMVAFCAEQANHHPEITIDYKKVSLRLFTHDENKITQKDLDLLKQIENINKP
jgi:4a-hydroxytetrahydrobiopterin dehydratase